MSSDGPLPNWLSPVARVAAAAYGAAVRARAHRFDSASAAVRVGVPVVSVGNLTAGGTGKTPFVRWCVRELLATGHHPIVALRGYRSRGGQSDEAMEYKALLPNVPLAVGPNRVTTVTRALAEHPKSDCAVLDDAFQHRGVWRDLDIVLVDATRPGLAGALLPAGWLREPPSALRRAGLVVVTRATRVDAELAALIERHHGRPPAAWCRHTWTGLDVFGCAPGKTPVQRSETVAWLSGQGVVAAAALGNPAPFVQMLRESGAIVRHQVLRGDHAGYRTADAEGLARLAEAHGSILATTWKDWTKLGPALAAARHSKELTVVIPRLEIGFLAGKPVLQCALEAVLSSFHR